MPSEQRLSACASLPGQEAAPEGPAGSHTRGKMAGSKKPRLGLRSEGLRRSHSLKIALAELSRDFYRRGWVLGTSGNFSAVASCHPFRMLITPTGVDKGQLTPGELVLVDAEGKLVVGRARPSVETAIHLSVVRGRRAGAVLHTHSVWSTILSDQWAGAGGLPIEGYEMLKGLEGVQTHEQREWLPVLENSQDLVALAAAVEDTLSRHPQAHGFLLRRHGLYTWGETLTQAKRHLEILEFLLEAIGRTSDASHSRPRSAL